MHSLDTDNEEPIAPTYAARLFADSIPKFDIPKQGTTAQVAYQLVHDELQLDGNPALNLASFVTSWMEPEADQLAKDTLAKNLVDQDEYPRTQEIHQRVVTMVGRLFHIPGTGNAVGTATIGSSEAIMLAMIAHKRSWRNRRKADGKSIDRPNMIIGADVHTCWEKFARYFEVEPRIAPMEKGNFTLSADDVKQRVDENTIGVCGLLGTTFTGDNDDLSDINDMLAAIEEEKGWKIPLHIDAASGGFIYPFSEPDFAWDFRLSHVRSINVSNHKFGLVYPGMGTVIFRDKSDLPEELVFHINYLGGDMTNYSLNFSRPSDTVVLQYFNFIRLGRAGYEQIVKNVLANAQALANELRDIDALTLINDGTRFPMVCLRATDPERLDVGLLAQRLLEHGWIIPSYSLPANLEDITVLRMVIKENFSRDMVDMLCKDIHTAVHALERGNHKPGRKRKRPIC